MKKNIYKVLVASIALLAIPTAIYFTQELQKDELQASVGGMKTTVNQYERIKMGGRLFSALSPTSFLVDIGMGPANQTGSNPMNWTDSLINLENNAYLLWTGFSTKERGTVGSFLLNGRIPSKADLPIEGNVLNSNIPNHDNNWWLMDESTGDGNPRSFVNTSNQVDAGYNREVAANTGATSCGKKTELFEGGLNTTAYTGPSSDGMQLISFSFTGTAGTSVELTNIATGSIFIVDGSTLEIPPAQINSNNLEYLLYDKHGNDDPSCGTSEIASSSRPGYMGDYVTFCNGNWKFRIGKSGSPTSGKITGAAPKSTGSSCPGINVPFSLASVRPVVDTNLSSVFSIMSDPSVGVSDTLAEYPDAGSGPYTFQLKDDKLKMQLDASVEGVSNNSIDVDATVDGKISIPYDIGGSTYDSESQPYYEQMNSTIYISAMSNGKYAKLGTANKNGKGSVVLDVNDLVTKTSGKIDTQTITFDLYQEEITNDGYTNYISQPTTITINIKGLKDAQAPLTITNEETLPYNVEQPNFKITAQGGSGTGALSYAIKTDSDHIASIAGDTITYTKAGTITITATKAEDDTYSEIVSEKTITIQKAKQNIEITNGDFKLGSASNFKITIAGRSTTLTTPLVYALTQGDEFATLSGDTITPSKVGSIEVSVTSKGDAVYEDCTVKKTINIANKDPQTPLQITNTNKFAYDVDDPTFEIETSGGSGSGALTYTIKEDVNSVASISGNIVTYNKAGSFIITATKASDSTYQESTAEKAITIDKLKQAITITNTDFKLGSANDFKITVDGRVSTLTQPLTYELTLGKGDVASIVGDTITPIKAGTIEISVTSKGNGIYEDVTVKKQIKLIEKENQNPLVITNTDTFTYDLDTPSFEIETSGGSGSGALTYTIKEDVNSVASISGNIVTYNKAGSFTITAIKASDDTYKESIAEKVITIDKIEQSITISNTDFKLGSASDFKIIVDGRVGALTQPLTYDLTLGKGDVASIVGDTITPIKAGTIEILVTSKGNGIYEDVTVKKQIKLIEKENQNPLVITNTDTFTYDLDTPSFEIETSGGSGSGALTYAIKEDVDGVASISGNIITYNKAGSFTITATKASDDTYKESIAEKVITIDKLTQAITITNEKFVIGTANDFKVVVEGRIAGLTQPLTYDIALGKNDVASIVGDTITPLKAGTIEISVTSLGNAIYEDCTITKQIEIAEKENQTPLVITNPDKRVYDKDHLSFAITTSGGSGSGAMSYAIKEDTDGIASLQGNTITYTKSGRIIITATKAGDDAFKESIAEKTIVIEKMKQSDFAITNSDFIITSSANFKVTTRNRPSALSSPLLYDISVGKGSVASISGDVITPITTGNLTISVTSKGNDIYEDITVEKAIKITKLPSQNSEISITNGDEVVYGENHNSLQITTSGGQGNGLLTYKISPEEVATIDSSGLVSILKAGVFEVEVNKSGGGIYADSVARKQITVEQGEQADFRITNTDFIFQSASNFAITTTGRLNELTQPLEYDITDGKGDVATLSGNQITPLKVGTITISVKSKGNTNYKDKTATKSIEISNLPEQNVALSIHNEDVTWGEHANVMQINTSGGQGSGALSYSLQAGDEKIASINETTGVITIKKVGTIHVSAKKAGNGIYQDAHASKTIEIKQKDITITPKKITKKVLQQWTSVSDNGYDITPSLVVGDTLQGTPQYSYASDVSDDSPAGTYKFIMSGLSNPNYNITYHEGVLLVEEDVLDPEHLSAYYHVKSGIQGLHGWYVSDIVFESLKKDGYDFISDTKTFVDSEFAVIDEGVFTRDIYFKNKNGSITQPIQVPLKIDKTAPIMEDITLREKNTNTFAKFINMLSFGNWFKQEIEVEFRGSDNLSDVTFLYQEEIDGELGEWKETQDKVSYGNGTNVILHVKAIDEAGNESVDTMTSALIQIDLDSPLITGIEDEKEYYLPKVVEISDANSGLNMDASYFVNVTQKPLHEHTLFNGVGDISLHVEDLAGNVKDVTFTITGLPPIDSIVDDDASREIVKDVQDEYDDIKDDLTSEEQKKEIEDWLEKAKEKSKKYVDIIKEPDSGILIDGDGNVVFEEEVVLMVEVITTKIQSEKIDLEKVEGLNKDDEIKAAYDIYLLKGNEKIQPNGMVKVKIPNTTELKQIEDLKLVYINDKNSVTLYPSTIDDEYITFSTDHFSNYAIVGKRSKINIDIDKDGVPDLNIDTDEDGLPDLNLDIDNDDEADLNIDTNLDRIPDINIDTEGDGKANVNIDVNGDGVADINIAEKITVWRPNANYKYLDFAYDSDKTIKASINIDNDGDGKADINIDTDGDGIPDENLDEYWENKRSDVPKYAKEDQIDDVATGDIHKWDTWWITTLIAIVTMVTTHMLSKKLKKTALRK